MIKDGYVMVNDRVVTDSLYMVNDSDSVSFAAKINDYANGLGLILFNKPRGIWTNCKVGQNEQEVVDLLPNKYKKYSSIGRLDKDSEGLILFTNDGAFANRFLNSNEVHERRYLVWTKRELSDQELKQLATGILLDDGPTLPATVNCVDRNCYEFILTEGKNRQIRRMIEFFGTHAIRLKRTHFGDFSLGSIGERQFEFEALTSHFFERLV